MNGEDRPEPPLDANEVDTLIGFLNYQRATTEWRCSGLDHASLMTTVGSSTMTLGGLLQHLAYVEDEWTTRRLLGRDRAEPWASVDFAEQPDWDWDTAQNRDPSELLDFWKTSVIRSQAIIDETIDHSGLDILAKHTWPDGTAPSLRWVLVHLIEEYARHNGHADLIREAIDGQTGE